MNDDPNADLERRLRAGLRQGSLPGAPDAVRERLVRLPSEPGGSRLSTLFSGIRLAALASAAAVVIAFVLIVRALPGPSDAGPGASLGSVATTGPSASATTGPTLGPTIGPTSGPSTGPSSQPSVASPAPSAAANCSTSQVVKATTTTVAQITDVRVGTHPGYDRIVFEFAGTALPQLTAAIAQPPFVEDASGQPVSVPGNAFVSLKLFHASGYPTYSGPDSFSPNYPNLVALVNSGDYEGYVTWIAGLRNSDSTCFTVSTLTGPTRIVVDIQAP
jgi:hypothetical protein